MNVMLKIFLKAAICLALCSAVALAQFGQGSAVFSGDTANPKSEPLNFGNFQSEDFKSDSVPSNPLGLPGSDPFSTISHKNNDEYLNPYSQNSMNNFDTYSGSYPNKNYPVNNYPVNNYAGNSFSSSNYPSSNYPSSNYPSSNYPSNNYHRHDENKNANFPTRPKTYGQKVPKLGRVTKPRMPKLQKTNLANIRLTGMPRSGDNLIEATATTKNTAPTIAPDVRDDIINKIDDLIDKLTNMNDKIMRKEMVLDDKKKQFLAYLKHMLLPLNESTT